MIYNGDGFMKLLKIKKVFLLIFTMLAILNIFNSGVYAAVDSIDDIITGGDSFIDAASSNTSINTIDTSKMKNSSNLIYTVLLSLGIIAAVIIATVLGIQYMLAGAESKAKIKESMIPFVIGCIILFSAFAIWKAVVLALK